MLTKEEVLHVAKLAKIHIDDHDLEKYQIELKQLLDEVEKINDISVESEDILIAPWSSDTVLREDIPGEMLIKEEVLLNVPKNSGSYIEVPRVLGSDE